MKDLKVKLGFGKKEAAKTGKGAVVGGAGAFAYSIISTICSCRISGCNKFCTSAH